MPDGKQTPEISINPDEAQYLLVVYGEITGFGPRLSCRRTARGKNDTIRQHRLKQVKCPHCATRFADTELTTRVEVVTKPNIKPDPCHLYRKCDTCGVVFGINIVIVVS